MATSAVQIDALPGKGLTDDDSNTPAAAARQSYCAVSTGRYSDDSKLLEVLQRVIGTHVVKNVTREGTWRCQTLSLAC